MYNFYIFNIIKFNSCYNFINNQLIDYKLHKQCLHPKIYKIFLKHFLLFQEKSILNNKKIIAEILLKLSSVK